MVAFICLSGRLELEVKGIHNICHHQVRYLGCHFFAFNILLRDFLSKMSGTGEETMREVSLTKSLASQGRHEQALFSHVFSTAIRHQTSASSAFLRFRSCCLKR